MKKLTAILSMILVLCLLSGCAGTTVVYYSDCTCPAGAHVQTPTEGETNEPPVVSEGDLKTGLAVITTAKNTEAEDGSAIEYDVTVAAVLVDDNGVIVDCVIDSVGTSLAFGADGVITTDLTAAILTKTELGDAYGMKAYGGAAYEWYEQAGALADYAVGKTVEELKAGAVDETGHAADADLATSATIYLGGYVSAVEAAVANAKHLGAQAGDELKLASINSLDATPGEGQGGAAQLSMDVTALTMNGDTITSCCIDALQAEVTFDTTGAITSDLAAPQTKNQLGEAYGMKAYAGSQYEWYEQAQALADYAVGKTVEELRAGAVNESGKAADADLASTATIYLGGYVSAIEAAAANARHLGAQAGDELKIAAICSLADSASPEAEKAGNAQLNVDVTAITVNGDVITSCVIDSVQAKVAFTAEGVAEIPEFATKNELGEAYGMKAWGGATYEWNEQAANFAAYVTGKTAAEVAGIAIDEATKPTDADLSASVTISIGGFQSLIAKAAQ